VLTPISDVSINYLIPPSRSRYLSEIASTVRDYKKRALEKSKIASKLYNLEQTIKHFEQMMKGKDDNLSITFETINQEVEKLSSTLDDETIILIKEWEKIKEAYSRICLLQR